MDIVYIDELIFIKEFALEEVIDLIDDLAQRGFFFRMYFAAPGF